jgi:hypothetical protein
LIPWLKLVRLRKLKPKILSLLNHFSPLTRKLRKYHFLTLPVVSQIISTLRSHPQGPKRTRTLCSRLMKLTLTWTIQMLMTKQAKNRDYWFQVSSNFNWATRLSQGAHTGELRLRMLPSISKRDLKNLLARSLLYTKEPIQNLRTILTIKDPIRNSR